VNICITCNTDMPANNRLITNERRQNLWTLLTRGMKGYEIAKELNVDPSTISRDIQYLTIAWIYMQRTFCCYYLYVLSYAVPLQNSLICAYKVSLIARVFFAALLYLESQHIANINWDKLQLASNGVLLTCQSFKKGQ
jgi:HTH domain